MIKPFLTTIGVFVTVVAMFCVPTSSYAWSNLQPSSSIRRQKQQQQQLSTATPTTFLLPGSAKLTRDEKARTKMMTALHEKKDDEDEEIFQFLSSDRRRRSTTTTDRREATLRLMGYSMGLMASAIVGGPKPTNAATQSLDELDFAKIQDLLGKPEDDQRNQQVYTPQGNAKRPMYLTEPTDDFKENERKSMEFKKVELQRKKEFNALLEKLQDDPNDEKLLTEDLNNMTRAVRINKGLPLGITKEEVVKQVRRRKAKKYWPTAVEVAYQDLIYEIQYQQSPNTQKDAENPL